MVAKRSALYRHQRHCPRRSNAHVRILDVLSTSETYQHGLARVDTSYEKRKTLVSLPGRNSSTHEQTLFGGLCRRNLCPGSEDT